jgi:hypothetical protein
MEIGIVSDNFPFKFIQSRPTNRVSWITPDCEGWFLFERISHVISIDYVFYIDMHIGILFGYIDYLII